LREAIERVLTDPDADAIIRALVASARRKRPAVEAAAFLRDTYEGKPAQSLEITGKVEVFTRIEEARKNAGNHD